MMEAIIIIIGSLGTIIIWSFSIRPYVVAHGQGNKTGANMGVAMWVDWQSCGEIAAAEDDPKGRRVYRIFGALQLMTALGFLLLCF
ncbi:MAG: hypothetical protein ACI9SQ_001733 [Rubritalea sp.]|jgi:hypothetical protein